MEFIITSGQEYSTNVGVKPLVERLKAVFTDRPGYCYFRFPLTGLRKVPDLLIFDEIYGITSFDVKDYNCEELDEVSQNKWKISGQVIDSPMLDVEDYYYDLMTRYQKNRTLRKKLTPKENYFNSYLFLSNINKTEFVSKFPNVDNSQFIFRDDLASLTYEQLWKNKSNFTPDEGKLFISFTQGINVIRQNFELDERLKAKTIGEAISLTDRKIALMDKEQHKAAIQIPEGPQVIRGMAGTGKTIILAMKAAYLHFKYPDKKILYTFNTHSLYNITRNLIKKFYSQMADSEPDWNNLLVLHAWGGKVREGVYYRVCMRNSIPPKPYYLGLGQKNTLDAICRDLLKNELQAEFDYVLVDEAQDLPQSFFELLWVTTKNEHAIIVAYDELQSLTNKEFPEFDDLFGRNHDGSKRVDFSKGTYENGIEMEYILEKSYRNPLEILMVAHGLGLGIYNKDGIMQMIESEKIWETIGYKVRTGPLEQDNNVVIERPAENSISLIHDIYQGNKPNITYQKFEDREKEIDSIAEQIVEDVTTENVPPEQIIVINLDESSMLDDFSKLQNKLYSKGIISIIPGMKGVDKDIFGDSGKVTLSTVFKAKGNEAYVIYIMRFEYLYDYEDFVNARNKAFTSITRSKGWCRISGVGANMDRAITEIKKIEEYIPFFKFTFPNPTKIKRKLQSEQYKRRAESKKTKDAILQVSQVDSAALESVISKMSKKERSEFLEKLTPLLNKKNDLK